MTVFKEITPKSEKPKLVQVYKIATTTPRCKLIHWYSKFFIPTTVKMFLDISWKMDRSKE